MFYRKAIDALFYLDHPKRCKIDQMEYEKILQIFSNMTYWKERFTWKKEELEYILTSIFKDEYNIKPCDFIQDMVSNISIWTEDEGEYSFVHRSFQEYFAAHYIKNAGNKKTLYSNIREFIKKGRKKHIIDNILDLLEEIDKGQHREYLLLPILKHIQKYFKYIHPKGMYMNFIDKEVEDVEYLINQRKKYEQSSLDDM